MILSGKRVQSSILSLAVFFVLPSESDANPVPDPKPRSFRPVVPIKKSIPGSAQVHSHVVRLTIPQPPAPMIEASLFPENSVPDIPISPGSEIIELSSFSSGEFGDITDLEEGDIESEIPALGNSKEKGKAELSLSRLREEAHKLADMGLTYEFGSDDPGEGGMDCSGVIQYLLSNLGVDDVPRTSYDQYAWLKRKDTLDDVYGKSASSKMLKRLSPGDLIFWGGTWDSGHRVSHVMLYMGYNPEEDKHYVFGARSKSSKGLLGNGVDIFELEPDRGRLIAHGKIPGLQY